MDHNTVIWWTRQQQTSYADLLPLLPGPLGDTGHAMLDNQDVAMVRKVRPLRYVQVGRQRLIVPRRPRAGLQGRRLCAGK